MVTYFIDDVNSSNLPTNHLLTWVTYFIDDVNSGNLPTNDMLPMVTYFYYIVYKISRPGQHIICREFTRIDILFIKQVTMGNKSFVSKLPELTYNL
jgi:hypothetical protein